MDEASCIRLQLGFHEIVGVLVASACGLLDEPPSYGPLRLIDSASRLIALLEEHGLSSQRLTEVREKIEEGKTICIGPPNEWRQFLESLLMSIVED